MFLKRFQLPFTLLLIFLVPLDSSGPVVQGLSQSIHDGSLVGTFPKENLGAIQLPRAIRHSILLAQQEVTLGNTIIGGLLDLLIAGR